MRRFNRPLSVILLCAALAALFGACSKPEKEPEISAIAEKIDAAIGNSGDMIAVEEDYIRGAMKMDVSAYAGYCVKINAYGANVDEYGIFKGADARQAEEIKKAVDAYLKMRIDTWMDAYMPEEKPKMAAAELETKGNYVCYCVLSEEKKAAAFKAFQDAFKS
jgi:hypothetical protein